MMILMEDKAFQALTKILERYNHYERFLNYPGDWGERAFRGWLVFDLFHKYLGWSIEHIVFGERFDVLLINDEIKPLINIETKKPGDGATEYEIFIKRLNDYQTLYYAILTDGYEWLSFDCLDKNSRTTFNLSDGDKAFEEFVKPFWSKRYVIGGQCE